MKNGADNPFKEVLLALAQNHVDFIVAGGVAAILHGVPRVTMDLDVSIGMEEANIRRFLDVMKKLLLVPRAPVPAEALLHPEAREKIVREKNAVVFTFMDANDPLRQVDVFLTRELSYEELVQHTVVEMLDGHRVRIISAGYLLKLKKAIKPAREKDKMDIRVLSKLLKE
jgi:hypothetical protein